MMISCPEHLFSCSFWISATDNLAKVIFLKISNFLTATFAKNDNLLLLARCGGGKFCFEPRWIFYFTGVPCFLSDLVLDRQGCSEQFSGHWDRT